MSCRYKPCGSFARKGVYQVSDVWLYSWYRRCLLIDGTFWVGRGVGGSGGGMSTQLIPLAVTDPSTGLRTC